MRARFMKGTPFGAMEIEMQLIPGFEPYGLRGDEDEVNRSYEDLLQLFLRDIQIRDLARRVKKMLVAREVADPFFRNAGHKRRFQSFCQGHFLTQRTNTEAYTAGIFLLSADEFLWSKAKSCISGSEIQFSAIQIRGVDLAGYAIFKNAKSLYKGQPRLCISELGDPELIDDELLRLIINAYLIRRHGLKLIWRG